MKIIDCFMYFNEDLILDIRLHELYDKVDKFIIVESCYTHSGSKKNFNFKIENYKKFSDKIEYIQIDHNPQKLLKISEKDTEEIKMFKEIENALTIENYQRNFISRGLKDVNDEDIIMISDLDEIPNLDRVDFKLYKNKIFLFKQYFFHYKFDLYLKDFFFFGTKACSKKNFITPQWLRNIKNKKYDFYRIDTLFSNSKYINVKIIENGGWHFTNIMTAEKLEYKLKSYLHHPEIPQNVDKKSLSDLILSKQLNYDHQADKKSNRYIKKDLNIFDLNLLPNYIKNNKDKFSEWFSKDL